MDTKTAPYELLRLLVAQEQQAGSDSEAIWKTTVEFSRLLAALPSNDILDLLRSVCESDSYEAYWACVRSFFRRTDEETFARCGVWAIDPIADRRRAAADVLSEWGQPIGAPHTARAVPLLEVLLQDRDESVVAAALAAYGKLKMGSPSDLVAFASHANADVRFACVMALSARSDPVSNSGLVHLSNDLDSDVRDWATFGLAQLSDFDSPEIRAALFQRIHDDDAILGAEIRGEALIGLARRRDLAVLDALKQELAGDFHGAWCIEAAQILGDPSLHQLLVDLKTRMDPLDLRAFGNELDQAISACSPDNGHP